MLPEPSIATRFIGSFMGLHEGMSQDHLSIELVLREAVIGAQGKNL